MKLPLSLRLTDETAEKVRLSHERAIKELQSRVLGLPTAGLGVWEHVETKTLTANATEVGFANLRGNTDVEYMLRAYIFSKSTAGGFIELRPNQLSTNTRHQRLSGIGTGASASSGTILAIARLLTVSSAVVTLDGTFYARTGGLRVWRGFVNAAESSTPSTYAEMRTGYWSDTTTEVTSLLLVSSVTNALGKGSEFVLYRRAR